MSLYQKLYPNLNFNKVQAPSAKTMNISTTSMNVRATSVPKQEEPVRAISQPKERPQSPVVEQIPQKEEVIEKKVDKPKRKVVVKEEKSHKIEEPTQTVEAEQKPKAKVPRPNRVKPEPKPEPKRSTTIPKKGEQGLQPKYTFDQKKQIYLERLSRKSVKNAEREVSKVNEILEKVEHDATKLAQVEKEMKQKLKLINSAKFFAEKPSKVPVEEKPEPVKDVPKSQSKALPIEPVVEDDVESECESTEYETDEDYESE